MRVKMMHLGEPPYDWHKLQPSTFGDVLRHSALICLLTCQLFDTGILLAQLKHPHQLRAGMLEVCNPSNNCVPAMMQRVTTVIA